VTGDLKIDQALTAMSRRIQVFRCLPSQLSLLRPTSL
jgi:hypothetical protein